VVSTPRLTEATEVLRGHRIPARAEDAGVRVDLTGSSAPEVISYLVHAGIPVHEARRERTGLEELFARLTETEAVHGTEFEEDVR
jgi:ABC-2 type transport system ATP-binding protein